MLSQAHYPNDIVNFRVSRISRAVIIQQLFSSTQNVARHRSIGRTTCLLIILEMRREKSMPSVWIAPLTRCDSGALTDKVTEGQTIQVSSTWLSHILRFGLTGIRCALLTFAGGSWRSCGKGKKKNSKQKKICRVSSKLSQKRISFFYFKFHPRRFSQPISFLYGIQWPIWRRARSHTKNLFKVII